jgi:hypothetical protein
MSSKEKKLKQSGGRIPIPQAKEEIKRWKNQFLLLGDDPPYDFVQSFFIPMHDIQQLYENYKHLDPTGVRAYIGITDKDENGCAPLRLLLVPAKKHTDFYNHHKHHHAETEAEIGDELGVDDAGDSSVYDFTTPCPDVCATANELNS